MDQPTPLPEITPENPLYILESQIRECYGRVVYSHKTHEKYADNCEKKLGRIKFWQIFLSAVITGGVIITLLDKTKIGAVVTGLVSTALLVLNAYTKNYNLGEIAQMHKDAATKLWAIRESYLSLLTDIRIGDTAIEQVRERRDKLQCELAAVYDNAPRTNFKAYTEAQRALKDLEDMTFSDEEIDKFLPKTLKRLT